MKKSIKILSMLLFGIFSLIFVFGISVKALELVEEPVDDVWYFRKGGNQSAFSAQFKNWSIDGKTTYCIEPGEHITTNNYIGTEEMLESPYSDEINEKIRLIAYYGYDYPGHNHVNFRMAAQALIWELTGGQTVEFWTKPSGAGAFINVMGEKNVIMNLVNNHKGLPSFSDSGLSGSINSEITFMDALNNLSAFEVLESNDYDANISNNILTVIPKQVGTFTVKLKRKMYTDNKTTLFVGVDSKSQMMGYFGVSQNDTINVSVTSYAGYITLKKYDSYTFSNIPRGDGELKGAIYGVYDLNNKRVSEIIISENGTGKSGPLGIGTYIVKEEKASIGYLLDNNSYTFNISESNLNQSKVVYEFSIAPIVEIYKVLNNKNTGILTPEEGITFEFYLKSSNKLISTQTTNQDGLLSVILPYGAYTVKQINTTLGYDKNQDFELNIVSQDTVRKVIADGVQKVKLKVIDIDQETNNLLKIDGIKFRIKNLDTNKYVCQSTIYPNLKEICEFELKDGFFITPDYLNIGSYQLEQVRNSINGYLWNSEPLKFSISNTNSYTYEEGIGNVLELVFKNTPVKGILNVIKTGEKFIIENNNYKFEDIKLNNVTFELYANNDVYKSDNTLVYKDKELIKRFVTEDGLYILNNLPLGSYCLKEINTNNDYKLLESPFCFEIEYIDEITPEVNVNIELKNYLKKGTFKVLKVDYDTNEKLSNSLIDLFDSNNNLIYSNLTDENGVLIINNLPIGKYKYIEKKAPNGYEIDDNEYYFEIKENDELIEKVLKNKKIAEEIIDNKVTIEKNDDEQIKKIVKVPNTFINEIDYYIIIGIVFIVNGIVSLYVFKKKI